MKIQPLDDRILIRPLESEEMTEGGIVLPGAAQEKPQKGIVEAVGPGKFDKKGERIPSSVKKGDTIMYGKYAGSDVKYGDAEYKILKESELLVKFE